MELKFWQKLHLSCVTCHISCVTCHMSVKCHMPHIQILINFSGQSGEASQWRGYYQQGLPRLVYKYKGHQIVSSSLAYAPSSLILKSKHIDGCNASVVGIYKLNFTQSQHPSKCLICFRCRLRWKWKNRQICSFRYKCT